MTTHGTPTAHELGAAIYDTAAAFMLAPPTAAKATELGFPDPLQLYIAGRLGVLGDTTPEVAAAAHGFLSPGAAAEAWPGVAKVCSRETATRVFAEACAEYGEDKLASLSEEDATRLADLAEKVVDDAPATALFAAWRAHPRPTSPRARAAHQLNLLREWRGGVHVAAVAAAGLRPLEAIMSDGGEFYAGAFGWPKPWPAEGSHAEQMAAVHREVDEACGRVIGEVLTAPEADELLTLARKACALLP
ncbi:MAG: hypothetical protein EKK42_30635 [Pseudonocardiaceae bacterium]|nr:MAG: hypothetical protein EKK42_30635 [Pseudonocardiaceae bacterium]